MGPWALLLCLVCPRTPRLGQHGVTKQIPHAQSSVSGALQCTVDHTVLYKALMEWFPHLCNLVATAARPTNDARLALRLDPWPGRSLLFPQPPRRYSAAL